MDTEPGERLRALREKADLSMARLAKLVSPPASASQINKLEKAQVEFTVEWARRLGAALGVNHLEFFGAIPKLDPVEGELVALYRGMAEKDQATVFKVAETFANAKDRE